jgi:alpha-beta hydrolase superfamily lysophospholipase
MTHHEEQFAAHDGVILFEQAWLPERSPSAVVAFVHGITEHSSRYADLAADLNQHGYAVYALDLRGHGRSEGDRVLVRTFDEYLDDVLLFCERVAARNPRKPVFVIGHSMGGAIVARLAIERQLKVRGVILSAPAVCVGGRVFPVLRHLASVVSWIWPTLRLTRMGCSFISRDPNVVADFRNDPLVFHDCFPVRTGNEILRAAKRIQNGAKQLTLPLLILHGTGDVVTDPRGSRLLVSRASSASKTLQLYQGLYHDLFHEPERDQVIADLVGWIEDHRR